MIRYLTGKIIQRKEKFVVVLVSGLGYQVFLSGKTMAKIVGGADAISLYCFHNVKEEASDLYGFLAEEELDFFEVLMDIRGVGPKSALEIAALGSLEKIKSRILAGDVKLFQEVPGIGAKKAMTIILELTGKIKLLDGQKKTAADPALDALMQLGFSRPEAMEALNNLPEHVKTMEDRVGSALKVLGKK